LSGKLRRENRVLGASNALHSRPVVDTIRLGSVCLASNPYAHLMLTGDLEEKGERCSAARTSRST
jgi:hypothetical protein